MTGRQGCGEKAESDSANCQSGWQDAGKVLWFPLVLYLLLAGCQTYLLRDELNPDGVSYLRNATYLVEGRYEDSISGYWSPLLSWCIVPMLYLGVDGLHAARIVLLVSGLLMCLASYLVVLRSGTTNRWLQIVVLSLVAIATSRQTLKITPDLLMSAILMLYFAVLLRPEFMQSWRLQALAGVLGGVAYLVKSYALPFVLVHLPFTIMVFGLVTRQPRMRIVKAWTSAVLLFAVTAGGWIAILSWKYEKPTFSTVARMAHTLIGPEDKPRMHPWGRQLFHVAPGRISAWETPEVLPYNHWSPFASREYFLHQVKHAVKTAQQIVEDVSSYDVFRLTLALLILGPLVTIVPAYAAEWRFSVWLLGTVILYSSGFLFVYYEARYIDGLVAPLCLVYCVAFGSQCVGRFTLQLNHPQWQAWAFSALVAVSFLVVEGYQWASRLTQYQHYGGSCREVAAKLDSAGTLGPLAIELGHAGLGINIAYHLDQPFLGCVPNDNVAETEALLDEYGVNIFLVPSPGRVHNRFTSATWKRQFRVELDRDSALSLDVFVRHQQTNNKAARQPCRARLRQRSSPLDDNL